MATVPVYNMAGEAVGEMDLPDDIFNVPVNTALLHEAVVMHLANRRVGTAATKTRGMVRGGGRKPWRQKHTGRARQGSIRAPHWKGGGTVFGPQPRDYGYQMPKRARRRALRSALSAKLRDDRLRVVDELRFERPRTREMARVLENLGMPGKALVVTETPDRVVHLSARNLPGVDARPARDLNVYEVLWHDGLVLTRAAVAAIEEVLRA
ncbi:MAG: 50S ribosomal protein L4 [Clostridia bacterium]|nr:50S ribosomal protein L4 [Clostridia bacterium]